MTSPSVGRHEIVHVKALGRDRLLDLPGLQENVGGNGPIQFAHPAIGPTRGVFGAQSRHGLEPLQLHRLAPFVARAGQEHGDVYRFLGMLRLDHFVEGTSARPDEPAQHLGLLGDHPLMREDALPHRRNAEIRERHEMDRLALALLRAHHEIERRADDHADEAVDLAVDEHGIAGGRTGDLNFHFIGRDPVDRQQQIEHRLVVGGRGDAPASQIFRLPDRRIGGGDHRPCAVLHLAEDALELHALGRADRHEHEIREPNVVLLSRHQRDGLAGARTFLDIDLEIFGCVVALLLRPVEGQMISGERPV
jgi:hypothetical protein